MDVREKLVDIVCDPAQINGCIHRCNHPPCAMVSDIVDALIENGVTVQEYKLGDKVYQADSVRIYESTISEITLTANHTIFVTENIAFDERAIGNSVFLSYAEAEAHLLQPPKGE